jgi:hypothetical protein
LASRELPAHCPGLAAPLERETSNQNRPCGPAEKTGLGTCAPAFYSGGVSGFLRFLGIVNAAIWLGASVFFTVFILPGVFSGSMHQALRLPTDASSNYVFGLIAQVLFGRFFVLLYICSFVALLHLIAEKLYLGRKISPVGLGIVIGILALSLMGGVGLQPKLHDLHYQRYYAATPEQRELARQAFGRWHGISGFGNLLVMAGLLAHLVRVSRPNDSIRSITFGKFWG